MTPIVKSQGIVLQKRDYKENGNLITILTTSGKQNLIVRGSKKINSITRNYTNVLTKLDYNSTSNMTINTLTEANILSTHINIIEDMDKMNVACAILEKIIIFSEQVSDTNLFYDFVNLILDKLDITKYPQGILIAFELKLLYLLGVSPELKKCVICGKEEMEINNVSFSVEAGGIICASHSFTDESLTDLDIKCLKLIYYIKPNKIDDDFLLLVNDSVNRLEIILDRFYQRHLDFTSKVKKIVSLLN